MKHYQVAGVSVANILNQVISLESYGTLEAGSVKCVDDNTLFNACSISKFLTGMLVVILAEEGLVDVDEDVNERLTSWKVPLNKWTGVKAVTLRSLLSHQSGIIDPEGSFSPLNITDDIPSMVELLEGKTPYCIEQIEVKYGPESEFHYSDAGFCIIEQLLEDVTGKSFVELMQENLFKPLDMTNSTYKMKPSKLNRANASCGHNKKGEVVDGSYPVYPYSAASGLWTTSSDLASAVLELMNALQGESKLGLSANAAKEMISSQGGKDWCGLGVFLNGSEKEVEMSSLGWGVGFQCMLVATPYAGHGLVVMTNTDLGVHQLKGIIGEMYQAYSS
ncbi:serine hydrolase domain-containing protein [Alkalihalophilus lindianensis]|uniref:Serine hydrolase domain-containing protein n=1 Tax=Alkalihalophilus lindianensis TaxID=1630542 RepID=A0ABU3X4N7_9BACI|nr:serine hydrolase domain-containing protein [Alkalihalophilus lindianensis]MDV2682855.1 serine hydrolase domain-containing protein [Alkalihalophilus lindianensis]